MNTPRPHVDAWRRSLPRKLLWGGAAALLLLPAVAMQFTREVDWTLSDFVFMGLLLGAAAGAVEVGMRISGDLYYRLGVLAAAGAAFLSTWINAAVGIIGSEDNVVNLLYFAVIAVALLGALVARLAAPGLARAMLAALALHVGIGAAALALGWSTKPVQTIGITLFLGTPWLFAAVLFRLARPDARVIA